MRADGVHAVVYAARLGDDVSEDHGRGIGAVEDGVEFCARVKGARVQDAQAFGGEIADPDVERGEALATGAQGGDLHATADAYSRAASFFVIVAAAVGFEGADDFLVSIGGEGERSGGGSHDRGIGRKRGRLGWERGNCFVMGHYCARARGSTFDPGR